MTRQLPLAVPGDRRRWLAAVVGGKIGGTLGEHWSTGGLAHWTWHLVLIFRSAVPGVFDVSRPCLHQLIRERSNGPVMAGKWVRQLGMGKWGGSGKRSQVKVAQKTWKPESQKTWDLEDGRSKNLKTLQPAKTGRKRAMGRGNVGSMGQSRAATGRNKLVVSGRPSVVGM